MDLFEFETKERLSREEAAELLHRLADDLARHNQVSLRRDGQRIVVAVPDTVTVEFEVEIDDEGTEVEIELKW